MATDIHQWGFKSKLKWALIEEAPLSVSGLNEIIAAGTIVLAAGIVPSVVATAIPVVHDQRGRIAVDGTMRSRSHTNVWALGDCAAIPGPDGRLYPALAQHTVREARHLARNIQAVIEDLVPTPFVFRPLGTMASLGHTRAVVAH